MNSAEGLGDKYSEDVTGWSQKQLIPLIPSGPIVAVEPLVAETALACHGIVKQGGLVVCHTKPNARVEVGRSEKDTYVQTADKDGILFVGFDRDEPAAFVRVGEERVDFDITPREYDTSRIDGLPKNIGQ